MSYLFFTPNGGVIMEKILEFAMAEGLGYVLFVCLLFYVLKQQEKRDEKADAREEKYQNIISDLSEKYSEIAKDVKEIKDTIFKKKG